MRAGSNPGKPREGTGGMQGRAGHGSGSGIRVNPGACNGRGDPKAVMDDPGKSGEKPVIGYRGGVAFVSERDDLGQGPILDLILGRGQHPEGVPRGRGLNVRRDLGWGCGGTEA